jgi:MFS superfamily sulfate permease-like transporter
MVLAVSASDLLEVVWVSALAGVGITLAFSLVVLGGGRSTEARRGGRDAAATAYAVLAGLAFVAFAAGVVFGVHVMLSK